MDCSSFCSDSFLSHSAPSFRPSKGSIPLKCKPLRRQPSSNHASVFKSGAIAPCTECGKQFNSWKALFGHMRCHPERPWRGMNMNQKRKPVHVQKTRIWAHIADEVTTAALILMEMSGQSVGDIVDRLKRNCDEEEDAGSVQIDPNTPVRNAEEEVAKLDMSLLNLNSMPPVDY